jgi:hypothetical protein
VLSTFLAGITNQKLEKSTKARIVTQIMCKAACGEGGDDSYILKIKCNKKYLTFQGHSKGKGAQVFNYVF